ncbi:MAG: DNA polymerase IV [Ilumatobacteraceae bacterium]|nr:DNA polymerase IV [Ilumatobacteraceae bacterium]
MGTNTNEERFILHVDMDAFFVSVELLDRPDLRGKPVVVGGTGDRGVVAAASYEARKFGVRSAMSSYRARRLCPDAIFLAPRHHLYTDVSEKLYDLMCSYTPLVEPLSVDEAFMDVTGSIRLFGEPELIADDIRRRVFDELGLMCSVGIAPVKFLAKLASEAAKPQVSAGQVSLGHGVFRVRRGEELRFLHPLPVQALWGVGPATLAKLERLGIGTVGDLAELGESVLVSALGAAHGSHLYALAHAQDERDVVPDRVAKSIGHEETFEHDLFSVDDLRPHLVRLADAVARRLRRADTSAGTLTLKVKFSSFNVVTRSVTPSQALTTGPAIVAAVMPLISDIDPAQGVRLVGIHAARLGVKVEEGRLFTDGEDPIEAVEAQWSVANDAIDTILDRYGKGAIGPASTFRSRRPGESPFGPQ